MRTAREKLNEGISYGVAALGMACMAREAMQEPGSVELAEAVGRCVSYFSFSALALAVGDSRKITRGDRELEEE